MVTMTTYPNYMNQLNLNYSNLTNSSDLFANLTDVTNNFEQYRIRKLIDYAYICICTFLVLIGLIGNIISIKVFMRSGHCPPLILQRHSLILLTLSNTIYLIVFFYSRVLSKLLNSPMFDSSTINFLSKIYLMNDNAFICKFFNYTIHVAICLNAFITTSFSLERAFVINFPYLGVNLRANHDAHFKILIACILLFSFILPSYTLFLVDIESKVCNAIKHHAKLYFYLTCVFVICTLFLPFLIISISNISIIKEICKNDRNFTRRTLQHDTNYQLYNMKQKDIQIQPCGEFENRVQPLLNNRTTRLNSTHRMSDIKNHLTTKMLIAISLSFVILNLPYFISWCFHSINVISKSDRKYRMMLSNFMTVAEVLFLLNHSIAGFLYFVSGKMYQEHVYAILGCANKRRRLSMSRVS